MSRRQAKKKGDPIVDGIENCFDTAHQVVDTLLWPLGPVDKVIHGTARGVGNWLQGKHPEGHDDSEDDGDTPPPSPPRRGKTKGTGRKGSYDYDNYNDNSGSNKYNNNKGDNNNNNVNNSGDFGIGNAYRKKKSGGRK